MKENMNLTLNHTSESNTIESIIQFINELLDCLKVEKKSKGSGLNRLEKPVPLHGVSGCIKLRRDRKTFEGLVKDFLKDFSNLPEKRQADVELHFFKAIKKIEKLMPLANADVDKNKLSLVCRLHRRELSQTLKLFKSSQKIMSDYLYPDNSQKISDSPELYQKLVDAWAGIND